jgi:hypothetical protein
MSRVQNYESHRHLPVLTIVVGALALGALIWFIVAALMRWSLLPGLGLLTLAIFVLALISRNYTTRLQDRIIKLEMRLRCRDLLGPERASLLDRLTRRQIVALRFASDQELPALLDRAVSESLSADSIKQAIRTWVPDWDRT